MQTQRKVCSVGSEKQQFFKNPRTAFKNFQQALEINPNPDDNSAASNSNSPEQFASPVC